MVKETPPFATVKVTGVFRLVGIAVLLSLLVFADLPIVVAKASPESTSISQAEQWVLARLHAGEIADLGERFLDEDDRVLSAKFIEGLLVNSAEYRGVPRHGVRIRNATVLEAVDLINAVIPHEVWLEECQFHGSVILSKSHFERDLALPNSVFLSRADFSRIKVDGSANIDGVEFQDWVSFAEADISGSLSAKERALFGDELLAAWFNGLRVGKDAYFDGAIFPGAVKISQRKKKRYDMLNRKWEKAYLDGKINENQLARCYDAVHSITAHANTLEWRKKYWAQRNFMGEHQ